MASRWSGLEHYLNVWHGSGNVQSKFEGNRFILVGVRSKIDGFFGGTFQDARHSIGGYPVSLMLLMCSVALLVMPESVLRISQFFQEKKFDKFFHTE